MDIIIPLFLGVIQGLTEFLPVSSSGHLVLLQKLTGIQEPAILFDICVHVGTLLAVLLIFYEDIKDIVISMIQFPGQFYKEKKHAGFNMIWHNKHLKTALLIIVGTIPTGLMGIFLRKQVNILFGNISIVGCMLIITGIFLWITHFIKNTERTIDQITLWEAIFLGIIQGFAIIPGISRSGATITAALLLKMDRQLAGKFSFLLSIPSIMGALVLELSHPAGPPVFSYPIIITASLISFAVGFFALKLLLSVVNQGRLYYFSPYCIGVGGLALSSIFFS
jgi:undecaprenyl-diphosphatase